MLASTAHSAGLWLQPRWDQTGKGLGRALLLESPGINTGEWAAGVLSAGHRWDPGATDIPRGPDSRLQALSASPLTFPASVSF